MSEPTLPIQYTLFALLVALSLVIGTMLALEAGRLIGLRRIAAAGESGTIGLGAVDGAVFGLLGLLIAFTFSGAAARFEARRALIVEETNNIGTAYRRIDLLPAAAQAELRDLFRRYLDARLATYRKLPDIAASDAELVTSLRLQGEIWQRAVVASEQAGGTASMLFLPAVNAMFDVCTKRTLATWMHPPWIIYAMLFILAFTGALLAGHGMAAGARNWIYVFAFAVTLGVSFYVILDMEFPRLGIIRVTNFDRALVELRQSMK